MSKLGNQPDMSPKSVIYEDHAKFQIDRDRKPTKAFKQREQERRDKHGTLGLYLGYSDRKRS